MQPVTILIVLNLFLAGCTNSTTEPEFEQGQTPSVPQATLSSTPTFAWTPAANSTLTSESQATPSPVSSIPVLTWTSTVIPSETASPTATVTYIPELLVGQLFIYHPSGIQGFALTDGTTAPLLIAETEWLDWGANFSQNKKFVAYWIKDGNRTELWVTSLPGWQPIRILELEEVMYDFAGLSWAVNDRYLIFNLSVEDTSGPLDDIKTIRTYVFDIETMELIIEPYWSGDCSILARSSQTNQLALWCHQLNEDSNLQEFLVLEPDEAPWFTQEPPDILIDDCLIYRICAWSQDGDFAAYVARSDYPEMLFYTTVDSPMPIHLDDGRTDVYSFPVWSPDGQLLYYAGKCTDGAIQCPNVVSVVDKEIIWQARNSSSLWGFEDISARSIVWSPDSRYLAMPGLVKTDPGIDEKILVFNITTQQEVMWITEGATPILDMVWVD